MWGERKPWRFWFLLAGVLCLVTAALLPRGRLGLFIHPRYHLFTVITCLVGGILLLHAAIRYRYQNQTDISFGTYAELIKIFVVWLFGKGTLFVIGTVVVLLIAPNLRLGSYMANRKGPGITDPATVPSMEWYRTPSTVYQLSAVLQTEKGFTLQQDKPFTLEGFVRATDPYNPQTFLLSRFILICCAIDAVPVDVEVYYPNWQKSFTTDQWIRVQGSLTELNDGFGVRPVIRADLVEPVEEPLVPYDYPF